ncbi:MAG: PLP-dependent transferase, partial [Halobacteria archaeon]|nr:PLP-dependent transferase [Halobacteria archaeon]
VSETQVFTLAESLGGVESLIELPAAMTHASMSKEERREAGIKDGLVRVSVGIENVDDLTEDLQRSIESVIGS